MTTHYMIGKTRLAGVLGFEPRYGGIRIRCLTAWLHPNSQERTMNDCLTRSIKIHKVNATTQLP